MKLTLFAMVLGVAVSGTVYRAACAATPTASFGVSVTVEATCMVLASGVTLGTDVGGMVKATSIVAMNCTYSTPYNVSLGAWEEIGAVGLARPPADVGLLQRRYPRSTDSQGRVAGGRTVDLNTVAGSGNGSTQTIAVHGNISAKELTGPGTLADTVTVTVSY